MKEEIKKLYNSENFDIKYENMKKYNLPLCFDTGKFGEYLTCIIFNTIGTGVSTGWDTESKLEVKTGTRIDKNLNNNNQKTGGIRWGINPKTHNKHKNEQSSYVLIFIDLKINEIHTIVGTLKPTAPELEKLIEIANKTLNLTVWGESVNTLPIRIVKEITYDIKTKEIKFNETNISRTDYFGEKTGKKLENTKDRPRGNVKRY